MHAIFQYFYEYFPERGTIEYPFDLELFKRQGEENSRLIG
jgi:hypothetical protein